ncbi:MAG: class I SAM-dependent methyltransferase, partial [Myxococcota bacterium]
QSTLPLLHNKAEVPKEFNKIAKRYNFANVFNHGYREDLHTSVQRMQLRGDEHMLDLCCGTGLSTQACLEHLPHGTLIGVDFSEGMLSVARQNFATESRASFSCQDAMQLDFPSQSFDAIFMAYGIRNMPDPQRCLQQLHQLLKPGGTLCIHEYSLSAHALAKPYWLTLGYGFILPFCTLLTGNASIFRYLIQSVTHFPRPPQFTRMLQDAGFQDVSCTPLKFWRAPILKTFLAHKHNA